MKNHIDINQDRSENVFYDKAGYPAYIRKGYLSSYPDYTAQSHWHDDIELILVLSGHMLYNINGEIIVLHEKEGVFVNTRQLHFGYSDDSSECIFICILLHPMLLCSSRSIEKNYVVPLLSDEHIPFYHFKGYSTWENRILASIRKIYNVRNEQVSELKIQRELCDIWITLCENILSLQKDAVSHTHHLSALKNMISYISEHYRDKISLENIAKAGNVGKTGCCTIFKKYTNRTPLEYTTQFRLRKSIDLLTQTDMTVLEISDEVGFSGASYFTETFRKRYGCTPSEYRKNATRRDVFSPVHDHVL